MAAARRIIPGAGPDLVRAGEEDSPRLDLAGFAGPLVQLLALARDHAIDLRGVSLAALVEQLAGALAAAGRATPLAHKGDWLVMAAWLVWLRSRLLLPSDTPAQAEAAAQAGRLRDRLLALREAQGLARWLAAQPQLGHDVFSRGAPESLGTGLVTDHQVDVVSFLWASMALFDDGAREADTAVVYRPPWQDLYSPLEARQRILATLADLPPDGAPLERFLPPIDAGDDRRGRRRLRQRAAWAGTLLAGLELAREGDVALVQEEPFMPIHLRPVAADAIATTECIDADARVAVALWSARCPPLPIA
jgi:segregation and condensation protein A